jgi:tetratricopeptide (TPR) repeat protein
MPRILKFFPRVAATIGVVVVLGSSRYQSADRCSESHADTQPAALTHPVGFEWIRMASAINDGRFAAVLRNMRKSDLALAQFMEKRGSHDEARQFYEEVLFIDPRSTDALLGLARLDMLAGDSDAAEKGFRSAIEVEPDSGRALAGLGEFYCHARRWNEAVAVLRRAVQAAPSDKTIQFHYAMAIAGSGEIAEGYSLLTDIRGVAAAHYKIALVLYEREELASCEEHLRAAIAENPELKAAHEWLKIVRGERDELRD